MIGSIGRRGPLAVFAALFLALPVQAQDRPMLVVWLDPTPRAPTRIDPTEVVRGELDARSFDLVAATWTGPRYALHLADARRPRTDGQILETLSSLRALPGVLAAGELLVDTGDQFRFWSGRVAVRFRRPTGEAAARAVGDALGLGPLERADRSGEVYLFDAELRASELSRLQSNATLLRSIDWLRPVDFVARDPSTLLTPVAGRFHRIPKRRNVVTLLLKSNVVPKSVNDWIEAHNGSIDDIGGPRDRWINVRFIAKDPPKTDEEEAEQALNDLDKPPLVGEVIHAGPAILGGPPAFLTDQLAVSFTSELARYQAAPILDDFAAVGFEELRRLPYLDHGYLFRFRDGASFRIYDAARELILQGLATFAIPNFRTTGTNASNPPSACGTKEHQLYMNEMDLCQPRTAMVDPWQVRVAVLDDGAEPFTTICNRLNVETVVDFESMQACHANNPIGWCSGNCKPIADTWTGWHGNGVCAIAAATRQDSDEDLVGVAPGVKLINARRPMVKTPKGLTTKQQEEWDLMAQVALADALWWLAGGNPQWCCDATMYSCPPSPTSCSDACATPAGSEPCLPERLNEQQRSDVINLSFTRDDFQNELQNCTATNSICAVVCAGSTLCGIIPEVLKKVHSGTGGHGIRPGGAVVVAAVGKLAQTDLADLETTVGVGSVGWNKDRALWLPYEKCGNSSCRIHNATPHVDTVAPYGNDEDTKLCTSCGPGIWPYGASSAATAAVSGIAAMMLQQNPNLTAKQVRCILRETADYRSEWEDTSGWDVEGCAPVITGGKKHSACMGRGMVNAAAAVQAAVDCKNGNCPIPCTAAVPQPKQSAVVSCGVCRQKELKKPGRSLKIGKITHPLQDWQLPAAVEDLLRCLSDRSCYCEGMPGCFELELVNPTRKRIRNKQARLCIGETCWAMPGTIKKWKPGETIRIPLAAQPEMAGYLGLGLATRIEFVRAPKGK